MLWPAGSARFDTPASLTEESIKVIFIPTLTTSYYQVRHRQAAGRSCVLAQMRGRQW